MLALPHLKEESKQQLSSHCAKTQPVENVWVLQGLLTPLISFQRATDLGVDAICPTKPFAWGSCSHSVVRDLVLPDKIAFK